MTLEAVDYPHLGALILGKGGISIAKHTVWPIVGDNCAVHVNANNSSTLKAIPYSYSYVSVSFSLFFLLGNNAW